MIDQIATCSAPVGLREARPRATLCALPTEVHRLIFDCLQPARRVPRTADANQVAFTHLNRHYRQLGQQQRSYWEHLAQAGCNAYVQQGAPEEAAEPLRDWVPAMHTLLLNDRADTDEQAARGRCIDLLRRAKVARRIRIEAHFLREPERTADLAGALVASANLQGLQLTQLPLDQPGGRGIASLLPSLAAANHLRELNLRGAMLTANDLPALGLATNQMQGLKKLILADNHFGGATPQQFAAGLFSAKSVEHLDVSQCALAGMHALALAACAEELPLLTRLHLGHNLFSADHLARLGPALAALGNFKDLYLDGLQLAGGPEVPCSDWLRQIPKLRFLSLHAARIDAEDFAELCSFTPGELTRLTGLDLRRCEIEDGEELEDFAGLTSILKFNCSPERMGLTHLYLGCENFPLPIFRWEHYEHQLYDYHFIKNIFLYFASQTLQHVAITQSNLESHDACFLAQRFVDDFPALRSVDLSNNRIGESGICAFLPLVRRNSKFRCLDVTGNRVEEEEKRPLQRLFGDQAVLSYVPTDADLLGYKAGQPIWQSPQPFDLFL